MRQSDQRGAVRDPQQLQLDVNPSRSRALAIVGGMLAVTLLMFGAYRLGWSSGRSATAAIEEGAPTAAEVVPVSVPAGVELDAAEAAAIGLKTAVVQIRAIARTVKLTGAVQVPPDSREFVGSRVEGKIATTHVNVGDTVKAGQLLATVQSADFETLQTEFLRAAAELPVAEAAADRQRRLLEIDAVAQKDVENAVAQYEAKKSELAGLGERLQILGLPASQVANLQETKKLVRAVPVSARLAGVVVNRNAVAGSPVNTSDLIFEIDNLATIWIEGDMFEAQLPSLRPGLAGAVTVPAYPGQVFEGKVQAVIPSVDREKRTSRLRVVLQNGKGLLEPGMFATLSITVGTEPSAVAVPIDALIEQGSSTFVFVKNGEQFVQQDVVVSARDETYAQISFGLVPNDIVVTDGVMQLYAKSLYR
jgi:cobalt-zinc-cadmium efflux system membrane fusion protein